MGDFIETRGSRNKKDAAKALEVIHHTEPKRRSNPFPQKPKKPVVERDEDSDMDGFDEDDDQTPMSEKKRQENELKKFKHEVTKFSMSGFQGSSAYKAKVALAISLGAKPPKNKKKNYKKVIEQRKLEKHREAKAKKFSSGFSSVQLTKFKSNKKTNSAKNNKSSKGILGVYGKVSKDKR